jgi:transcriptional regulator NrdR family protein
VVQSSVISGNNKTCIVNLREGAESYIMKIIKRSGQEVGFDISKILAAVQKANKEVPVAVRLSNQHIDDISSNVE